MPTLGKHSKAYPLKRFRQFVGWNEKLENARKIKKEVEGAIVEVPRELDESDYLYLHENYHVTDGIFLDENVIFSDVSPAWIDFCINDLGVKFTNGENGDPAENS